MDEKYQIETIYSTSIIWKNFVDQLNLAYVHDEDRYSTADRELSKFSAVWDRTRFPRKVFFATKEEYARFILTYS